MNAAFLGTGILGYPMAEKLLERGHKLWVYNRTREKARPLAEKGAVVSASPNEAIEPAQCVVLVLSDAPAIENVLFKSDVKSLKDKAVIQMGTIASSESLAFQKRAKEKGGDYFECPVLGSKNEAAAGALILLFGGSEEQFNEYVEFLKAFGPNPRRIGDVGQAAALKLALNHLIAAHAASFSLSLGLVQKSGVDVDQFMSILNDSSLVAPMYAKKLPNWLNSNYENPNFPLKHLVKDVELILKEAEKNELNTDVLKAIRDLLKKSVKNGLAQKDYSAVFETINER